MQVSSRLKLWALGCQALLLIKNVIFWDLNPVSLYTRSTNKVNNTGPTFDISSIFLVTSHKKSAFLFILDGLANFAAHLALCAAQDYCFLLRRFLLMSKLL